MAFWKGETGGEVTIITLESWRHEDGSALAAFFCIFLYLSRLLLQAQTFLLQPCFLRIF